MRRISYWILSTVSAVVLLVGFDASRHTGTLATLTPPTSVASGTTSSGTTGSSSSSRSGDSSTHGSPQSSTKNKSASSTQTVTGSVAQTQWGPVQVQLTVSNETITKVDVLQYPNGNGQDAQINSYALPILVRETTDQQSAHIDMVSGATVTSTGYLQSLQSAIDQANL